VDFGVGALEREESETQRVDEGKRKEGIGKMGKQADGQMKEMPLNKKIVPAPMVNHLLSTYR